MDEEVWSKAQSKGWVARDLDPKAITQVMMALHDGIDLRWALDPTFDIEACRDVVIAMLKGQFRAELSETFAGRDQSAWTRSELGGVDRLA